MFQFTANTSINFVYGIFLLRTPVPLSLCTTPYSTTAVWCLARNLSMLSSCTHYELLGVDRNAREDVIKAAYQKLALVLHPDKPGGSHEQFQQLQRAWQVLREPHSRSVYDYQLSQAELRATVVLHDDIELDDMDKEPTDSQEQQQQRQQHERHEQDTSSVLYTYPCRCGDCYRLTTADMHVASQEIILPCRSCSNAILVRLP